MFCRKGLSGSYNIFTLLTALEKAKHEGKQVNMTFIDIKKAYDTVDRRILWTKMKKFGVPEDIIELIKSFYTFDSMVFAVGEIMTEPLYPVRGLRQGDNLSPLLFLFYIAELSDRLNDGQKDISLAGLFFNHLLFADDLVIITYSYDIMIELHKAFNLWAKDFEMEMSTEKSKVVSASGHVGDFWPVFGDMADPEMYLEQQIQYRYLGLNVFSGLQGIEKNKGQDLIKRASAYKGAVFSIANTSGDIVDVGIALWETIVVAALLYALEYVNVTDAVIKELDGIQATFAKNLIGVCTKSANVLAAVELGMKGFHHRIMERQLKFYWKLQDLPEDLLVKRAFMEHIVGGWDSGYIRRMTAYEIKIGAVCGSPKDRLRKLDQWARRKVLDMMAEKKSLQCLRWPQQGWRKQKFICEDEEILTLVAFRVGYPEIGMNQPSLREVFGLPTEVRCIAGDNCENCHEKVAGNDRLCYHSPFTNHIGRIVNCPSCDESKVDMVHVLIDCRSIEEFRLENYVRPNVSIYEYVQGAGLNSSSVEKARRLLNDDMRTVGEYKDRGKLLLSLRKTWLTQWMDLWLGEGESELLTVGRSSHRLL